MPTHVTNRFLTGQFLIAMPGMHDPRFERSLIYVCAHDDNGAMGLVVNRLADSITLGDLLSQLDIPVTEHIHSLPIQMGGPVESSCGFVLHSADYLREGSLIVEDNVALTARVEILRDLAEGKGPGKALLALGYAGWGPGQLDAELQQNGWLNAPASSELLFDLDYDSKWERALGSLGVSLSMLSGHAGTA